MRLPRLAHPRLAHILYGMFAISLAAALFVASGESRGLADEAVTDKGGQSEFKLLEKNSSGVEAVVRLSMSDVDTRIEVAITGPDAEYLPYLHRGTCDKYNPEIAIPLALARPGEPTTTTVDMSIDELTNGQFVIDLHVARGSLESLMDPATSAACGALFDAGSSDLELQPPVAGIGPFDDGSSYPIVVALTLLGIAFGVAGLLTRRVSPVGEVENVNPVALQRLRGLFV